MIENTFLDFTDSDAVAVDLRRAVKLITLFIEFCGEGEISEDTSYAEAALQALTFTNRLDMHEEMLHSSLDILERDIAILEKVI